MTESNLLLSLRRTLVPIFVGYLLAQAVRYGFDIPQDALVGVVEALVTGLYYSVVRVIETIVPSAGVLLGAQRQPRY
jgi:hypothetical protein